MRAVYLASALLLTASLAALPARSAVPVEGVADGAPGGSWKQVKWERSLAAAQVRARREGKPVFVLSLFGRLDQEFC